VARRRDALTVAETSFEVAYDGPALADGRMAVRDLAPALIALGDVFAEASAQLYPEREPVSLSVKATAEGSFEVVLILHSAWEKAIDLFSGDPVTAIVNFKELILGGGYSLFEVIRRIRGRRVTEEEELPQPGMIRITLEDGTTLEVPAQVVPLLRNIEIRRHANEVIAPVRRNGIERLEFRTEEQVTNENGKQIAWIDRAIWPPKGTAVELYEPNRDATVVGTRLSLASDGSATVFVYLEVPEPETFLPKDAGA
jgi:hypothetical protein